ncbi:HNH endonuclease signature motif containing protein [Bdellovibrionota bacterium FG-1]
MQVIQSLLKNLSSEKLLDQTLSLVAQERQITASLISHFEKIEVRRLYAEKGWASMWEMCTLHFKMSEGSTHRYLSAMRMVRQGITPTLASELVQHVLSLSQRECDAKLQELMPDFLPEEKERVVSAQKDHELRIVISDEGFQNLQRIKGLLAHANPDASYGELIEVMVNETLERLEKKKGIAPSPKSEAPASAAEVKQATQPDLPPGYRVYLPVALRREVFARAKGQCEYTHQGRRCTSRFALELDHITPLALGGEDSLENARVLCRLCRMRHNVVITTCNKPRPS